MADANSLLSEIFNDQTQEANLTTQLGAAVADEASTTASLSSVLDPTQTWVYLKADGSAVVITFTDNGDGTFAPSFATANVVPAAVVVVPTPVAADPTSDAVSTPVAADSAAPVADPATPVVDPAVPVVDPAAPVADPAVVTAAPAAPEATPAS